MYCESGRRESEGRDRCIEEASEGVSGIEETANVLIVWKKREQEREKTQRGSE
mgnify:CR=1 FL=1